jgi:putative hydrolase of the HAD superfamily
VEHDCNRVRGRACIAAAEQMTATLLTFARIFWANAEATWRLKLGEARRLTLKAASRRWPQTRHRALPDDLAIRLADRFTSYREEDMFVFPAHEAIDRLKALGSSSRLVSDGPANL